MIMPSRIERKFKNAGDFVSRQADPAWVNQDKPSEHFFHNVVRVVNELVHGEANEQRCCNPISWTLRKTPTAF